MKRLITGLAILSLVTVLGGCGGIRAVPPTEPPVGTPGSTQTARLSQIHMIDSTNGWAVGAAGLLLRTTDGGRRWSAVTPKAVTLDENTPVFALNANTAWIASSSEKSTVYRTTDGGQTWQSGSIDHAPRDLYFSDATHGWAMSHDNAATGGAELVTLFRTVDGGLTWSRVAQSGVPNTGALNNFPLQGMKTGLSFRDPDHGWAAGTLTNVEHPWFYTTADGGNTWREVNLSLPEALQGRFVTTEPPLLFPDGRIVLPVWTIHSDDEQPAVVFLQSRDNGKTWTAGAPVRHASSLRPIYSFTDADHGFFTDGVRLFSTKDGGKTWQAADAKASLSTITRLQFINDRTGFALLSDGTLLRTDSAGTSWQAIEAVVLY